MKIAPGIMFKHLALDYLPVPMLKAVKSLHYRSSLKHYAMDDEPDLLGCQLLLAPGDTALDIGANIGVYTRFFSEFVGTCGHVIALEPMPETFSYLSGNVRSLGLTNVQCLNVAASDNDSDTESMCVPQYSAGGANLYECKISPTGNIRIKTVRLDTQFPDLVPTLIKCDVEGHEIPCIAGAMELIRRCRPKWMVEVTKPETFELFRNLGYAAFFYEHGDFQPYDPEAPKINYFFFPEPR